MGKCVAWDTRIVDPDTGAVQTVQELYRRHAPGPATGAGVLSVGSDRRLARRDVSAWIDDGVKPVFRVVTRLGRQVRTTASHPFLTADGWRPLRDLTVGTRIGVPRRLPVFGTDVLPDDEVAALAHQLTDATAAGTPTSTGGWPGDQRVPDLVHRLPRRQLALFVGRLWAADGCVGSTDAGDRRVTYTSVSRALVRDVQHLLLRFGLNAGIRLRSIAHRQTRRPAWELELTDADEIRRFCAEIGTPSDEETHARLRAQLDGRRPVARSGDAPATEILDHVIHSTDLHPSALTGVPAGPIGRRSPGHRTPDRGTPVTGPLPAYGDLRAPTHPDPGREDDLCWDEIVAIVADGEDRVYDLTVPVTHNFVADDIVVHNTAFALGIAAHAAMKAKVPTLVFSLEMSHSELTQRLLVSEARVDANRIRNGKLLESDWPKISNAIGRLGEAPLFIDDNPNLTVMEVRAKARRMKAKEGGLGLIIIDYLQLMSGRSRAENRQVEVSEISRGLKILARELEVPVVALSQLSRTLESRADKRPMLADLRESGSLEQDADVVMFLYRDEVYDPDSAERGTAEVIVSKHRNGPTGKTSLAFLDHHTRFEDMARI